MLKLLPGGPRAIRTPEHLDGLPDLKPSERQALVTSRTLHSRWSPLMGAVIATGNVATSENPPSITPWMAPFMQPFMRGAHDDDHPSCGVPVGELTLRKDGHLFRATKESRHQPAYAPTHAAPTGQSGALRMIKGVSGAGHPQNTPKLWPMPMQIASHHSSARPRSPYQSL